MGRYLSTQNRDKSVYQFSVHEKKQAGKKKQAESRVVKERNAFVNTPLRFLGLSWKFWKN